MENEKKVYTEPKAEKIEYDFRNQVVASGTSEKCESYQVFDGSYSTGRCWPLYSR